MPFLTLGSGPGALDLPVLREGGAEEAPDGQGKRRWTVNVAPIPAATFAALRTLVGDDLPYVGESTRGLAGGLQSGRPKVPMTGEMVGGATVQVEGAVTAKQYQVPARLADGTTDGSMFWVRCTLVLREF